MILSLQLLFHSYHFGAQCYHCHLQRAGSSTAVLSLSLGGTRRLPRPHKYSFFSLMQKLGFFCQSALSFPSSGLRYIGSLDQRDKTPTENPVFTVNRSTWPGVDTWLTPSGYLSLLQNPQPHPWEHSSESGCLPVPAGLKTITSCYPGLSASPYRCGLPPQLGATE